MTRTPIVAALCLLIVSTHQGSAQGVSQRVSNVMTPERFGPVEIVVDDRAVNGCWTSIGEARSLAADYLQSEAGLTIQQSASGKFTISVVASRKSGACSGSITLRLVNENLGSEAVYGERTSECVPAANCNPMVNYQILKFTEAVGLAAEGWDVTE